MGGKCKKIETDRKKEMRIDGKKWKMRKMEKREKERRV